LTARGIPTSGEGDLKTNVAQLILDRLGAGGSYTEYYALDFDDDFVLMGHDGPGHIAIAGCTQTADGALKLVVAEGESIPGETFRIGNTNSRLRFAQPPAEFFERWCAEGPTHHVALGVGHRAGDLRRVATLLDLEYAEVQ